MSTIGDKAIAIAQSLIRCESVTPADAGALDALAEALKPARFAVERLTFNDHGSPRIDNLFARVGDGPPHLCFAGHTDVVPPGDAKLWTHSPFAAEIAGGRLYGRGASDMKGAIACFAAAALDYAKARGRDIDGTISALTRIQTWWKDKLIPPDSPSWDDSKNNASYQSRQSAFVFNPASIFAFLDQNDKDLLKDTDQAPNPKGKGGTNGSSVGTWSWSVFSASKQVDAAKAMIKAIMQPDLIEAVYEKVGGRWYPVYKDLANAKFWKDRPYFDAFPQAIVQATPAWLPAQATPDLLTQLSAVDQKRIYAEMLQDVVVSNKSPQDAAKAAQTKMEQAFAEAVKK